MGLQENHTIYKNKSVDKVLRTNNNNKVKERKKRRVEFLLNPKLHIYSALSTCT